MGLDHPQLPVGGHQAVPTRIGTWVLGRINEKIRALLAKQAGYSNRTKAITRLKDDADLERRRAQLDAAGSQRRWTYGVGSDFTNGVLGHAEIIAMVPKLTSENDLLARIVARRFPFIFVDESQDAFVDVARCLKQVWSTADGQMCLGFFGDPMQQIYLSGIKDIDPLEGWERIEKPQNFRSSRRVLACVNAVRSGGDPLHQVTGLADQSDGEAYCLVVSADLRRDESLDRVRCWLDEHSGAGKWTGETDDGGAKVLMIEHRMAATRLGFPALHEAFRQGGSALTQSFEEGNAWLLKPFREVIAPLCSASEVRSPAVVRLLLKSPLLLNLHAAAEVRDALDAGRDAVEGLRRMTADTEGVTLEETLRFAADHRLVELDPRLGAFLDPDGPHHDVVLDDRTRSVITAMSTCAYAELAGYDAYIEHHSPYPTHQGTKGAEFDRVVVVLDDADSRHRQVSYDKLLGLKALSNIDEEHQAAGNDSVVERTRRLLYVCVSRPNRSRHRPHRRRHRRRNRCCRAFRLR
jgi:DNA helicase-2/ATP-dependent DNA helicase PcrA